jgi:membrane peptidoglycan carboxypeptidase
MDTFKAPRRRLALAVSALGGGVVVLAAAAFHGELALASRLQAYVFTRFTQQAGHPVMAGASPSIRFPAHGPFDERLGYVQLPEFLKRLQDKGCSITEQARWSERLTTIADWGLFPPYREPTQTGMQVLDRKAVTLLQRRFPEHTYARFEDIPKLIVDTLLFIENRELLDEQDPQRNPAVEVDRLARAILDRAIRVVDRQHPVPGGSTLATQIEKYRHSREGRTDTIRDKLQQMVSASLRAYQDGRDTRGRRKAIILDYLNTVPMAG